MLSVLEKMVVMARDLYPKGAAFRAAWNGDRQRMHRAVAKSEERLFSSSLSLLDSAIADNENFSADDALDWERRLGITGNSGLPLADRMQAINDKLNYPGTDAPRQHHLFIQDQLQAAGFDVYIHENNFGGEAKGPVEILWPGEPAGSVHGPGTLHGSTAVHGKGRFFNNKVANHVDEILDLGFVVSSNFRGTFYVSSAVLETFADVPEARKREFRQLILKLKPAHTVGYLFVNYV